MIKLREKDIIKLATILEIPQFAVEKMVAMNLIHDAHAVDMLITHDWKRIRRMRKYTTRQICMALANEYHVSINKVDAAVHNRRKASYYCLECGVRIRKCDSVRNDGLCDKCMAASIKV